MAQPPTGNPAFFGQKVSKPGVPVTNATDKQLVLKDDYTTRTYYDDDNARLLIGQLPGGSYGMLASKPGVEVTTATDDELSFSSNFSSLRVARIITDTQVIPGGVGAVTVLYNHDLNTVPFLFGSATIIDSVFGTTYSSFVFGGAFEDIFATVTSLNTFQVSYSQHTNSTIFEVTFNLFKLTNS